MIAWLALAFAILSCLLWVVFAVLVSRAWGKIAPSVTPMLQMFSGADLVGTLTDSSKAKPTETTRGRMGEG